MNFSIFLALLTWQLHMRLLQISADDENMPIKCPYENTVNLTNHQRYENGSYLYEGLIIPPEKQQFYDYQLNLLWEKESAPLHLRGCVCEERPCLRLCCQKDEYFFDDNWNTSKCEKITSDMKVSWELPLLLQSGKSEMTNIFKHFTTQMFILCENPEYLDPMLVGWILKEDGSLITPNLDLDSYCFSPLLDSISGEYLLMPYLCIPNLYDTGLMWKYVLFEYSQNILLIFLIFTVLVHLVLHELRRNLGAKIFFCYLISATICHLIVSILNFNSFFQYNSCMSLGFVGYYFYIASFSWLSILCYDIWKHINESYVELNSRKTLKQFIIYNRFAWLSAGLATFGFVFIELSPSVDNMFKPGFTIGQCWINSSKWSSKIYYLGPALIVLLLNIITFIRLMATIYKARRDVASFTQRKQFYKKYATVILRLFLMLGVPWFIHFLPFFLPYNAKFEFLYVLSVFFDGIQGVLIFVLFVSRRKVWELLKERFKKFESKATKIDLQTGDQH